MNKYTWLILGLISFNALAVGPAPEINPHVRRNTSKTGSPIFEGIVKLSNCSGSLVRLKGMPKSRKALVMTNGHCVGFTQMGQVKVNEPSQRTFSVFNADMKLSKLQATKIVYATQTYTDVTIYETTLSYKQIEDQFNVEAFVIEDSLTPIGIDIDVVSGYWEIYTSCKAEAIVPVLREDIWTWKNSVRYSKECMTKGGYSGSPVIEKNTRNVVAIHNTGNNGKLDCSDNNPCESNESGDVTFQVPNRRYAQQISELYGCFDKSYQFNLDLSTCELAKP